MNSWLFNSRGNQSSAELLSEEDWLPLLVQSVQMCSQSSFFFIPQRPESTIQLGFRV